MGRGLATGFVPVPGAYALANAPVFRASMRSSAETEPSAPTARFAWKYFGLHRRNFGSIFRTTTTSGLHGQRNRQKDQTSKAAYSGEFTGTRQCAAWDCGSDIWKQRAA